MIKENNMRIKKIVSVLCSVAVMLSVVCIPSAAVGESYIFFECVSAEGNELVLDLCIEDQAGHNVKNFGVYLNYSKNVTFLGCEFYTENGSGESDGFIIPGIPYQMMWTTADHKVGKDKLAVARLSFKTSAPVSESDITVSPGLDLVNPPKDSAGNVYDKVVFAPMNIVGGVIPPSPVLRAIPGDANEDGKVNLVDVTVMLQFSAQWIVGLNLDNADVTGDGNVNLSDVTLILKYIAKWDVELK